MTVTTPSEDWEKPVTADDIKTKQIDTALLTYRYLRMILVLPGVFLILATLAEAATRGGFRQSISDSYQGPVRDVFVGALMATGIAMIAYKGRSKLEDYALNFAGFNAFFVALVPNNFTQVLNSATIESIGTGEIVARNQTLTNLRLVLLALLITAVLFVILDYGFMHWEAFRWTGAPRVARILVLISWAAEIFFVVVIVGGVLAGREELFGLSIFGMLHFVAAGLLIGNLSFAVASRAWSQSLRTPLERRAATANPASARAAYVTIVVLMWAGIVIGGWCIYNNVNYSVIVTEYFEILMFVIFWAMATRKDWNPSGSALDKQPKPDSDP
jgi:hypothetical protein